MWETLQALLLPWLVPVIGSTLLFLLWEPWKRRTERLRVKSYLLTNPHIQEGICFKEITIPGGGFYVAFVYIEEILKERFVFRSMITGDRTILTGGELLMAIPTAMAHPVDKKKLLIMSPDFPALLPPATLQVLRRELNKEGYPETIWGKFQEKTTSTKKVITKSSTKTVTKKKA